MNTAFISNIQKFSLDDGPGIRTTVFFKGCNLSCAWCHNPECIKTKPILQFITNACQLCGACVSVCPNKVHSIINGIHTVDREKCLGCGACLEKCRYDALALNGKYYTVQELSTIFLQDMDYYHESNGGITFSGGEPMLQADFLRKVLQECQKLGLTTAVDTAGNISFSEYEKILPYVTYFLYDIKAFTNTIHKKYTGVDNKLILANIASLAAKGARLIIRVPIIPTVNDNLDETTKIAHFLAKIKPAKIELLPYHTYGIGKYDAYNIPYLLQDIRPPTKELMDTILATFLRLDLPAIIA